MLCLSLATYHIETFRDALLEEFIVYTEKMVCKFVVYWEKKITRPYAKKFDGLLVNNNKIVN